MRTRTITVKQYTNETKLMALIPARVKIARLQEELILEAKYLSSKSLSLEQRASKAIKVLKRNFSEEQWNAAKHILSPVGLTEIETGNMSDSDAAKAIADLAKELAPQLKVKDGAIDVKKLEPADIKLDADPASIDSPEDIISDPSIIKKEGAEKLIERALLKEFGVAITLILAAPTIAKFLGKIIEWIASLFRDPIDNGTNRVIRRMKAVAAKTGELPPQKELYKELGGVWKGITSGAISYEDDAKFIDLAYYKVADALKKSAKKAGEAKYIYVRNSEGDTVSKSHFDPRSKTPIKADKHLLHVLEDASIDNKVAKFLNNMGHKLHTIYVSVIAGVLFTAITVITVGVALFRAKKLWDFCYKVSDFIYAIGMLVMAIMGGFHAWHEISAHLGSIAKTITDIAPKLPELITVVVDAVKAGDMSGGIFTQLASAFVK